MFTLIISLERLNQSEMDGRARQGKSQVVCRLFLFCVFHFAHPLMYQGNQRKMNEFSFLKKKHHEK